MNNRACNVAQADLQKIMALKRAILESAELLATNSINEKQIEAVTVFVYFCYLTHRIS